MGPEIAQIASFPFVLLTVVMFAGRDAVARCGAVVLVGWLACRGPRAMTGPTRAGLSAGPGRPSPPRGAWMLFLLLLTSAVPESLEQDEDIPHNE